MSSEEAIGFLWEYLEGKSELFKGSYLNNYSRAETALDELMSE